MSRGEHWSQHARQWRLIGPPLRPCAEDIRGLSALLERWAPSPPRALLLGVTPEIVSMRWPEGTRLTAVDRNAGMIAEVFPHRSASVGSEVVEADWGAMPFADDTFDVIIGDGCLSMFAFPTGYERLVAELERVAAPDAVLILRLFASVTPQEALAEVAADLWARRIGNFHVLKWRVAMAIQAHDCVRLGSIHDAYLSIVPDARRLTDELGWDPAVLGTIDVYRGSDTCYSFPTVEAVVGMLARRHRELAREVPDYELGDRCPTLVLRVQKG